MYRACSMYGERRGIYRVLVRKTEGRDHLEEPRIDERIFLRWIFSRWDGGHGLAQDRDRWQALVNAMMNLQGPS